MAKIDFLGALKMVQKSVPLVTAIVFSVTIGAVVVGVLLQQVNAGTISIDSSLQTFLNSTWVTSVVSFFTSFGTAATVTLGLLVVVIIVLLFRSYLGSGNNGGDSM